MRARTGHNRIDFLINDQGQEVKDQRGIQKTVKEFYVGLLGSSATEL